jgi:hypothetical protein
MKARTVRLVRFDAKVRLLAAFCLVMGCRVLDAQGVHLSVASKVGQACGAGFATVSLQQALEEQLQAASIGVSRVDAARLSSEIDCKPGAGAALSVTQCLSLSQAVSSPLAAHGLHLANTWSNCQSYTCTGVKCGKLAISVQRTLTDRFIAESHQKSELDPAPPSVPGLKPSGVLPLPAVYAATAKPILKPGVVFWALYILTCMAVMARWGWSQQLSRTRS